MVTKRVVENVVQAKEIVDSLKMEGFLLDDIYIFAHDKERTEHITEGLDTASVGMGEQGVVGLMANIFRSRGDELREKMQALGLTKEEADVYEKELDAGKLVVIGCKAE